MDMLLAVVAGSAVILAGIYWRHSKGAAAPNSARAAKDLNTLIAWEPQATRVLTASERRAYMALVHALPEYMVFAQVPLARFIRVPTRHSYSEWLRRVGQLCPDLLICDATSQVVAVVEVRPPEEQASPRARRRLERMGRVLKGAGIPLTIWPENAVPTPEAAREAILRLLEAPSVPASRAAATGAERKPAAPAPFATPAATNATAGDAGRVDAALAAGAVTTKAPPAAPLRHVEFELVPDEIIEMREPPPSTWFDDLDSGPTPLRPDAVLETAR